MELHRAAVGAPELAANSYKTAVSRVTASAPARALVDVVGSLVHDIAPAPRSRRMRVSAKRYSDRRPGASAVGDVLDFGTGRGADVEFYRRQGLDAAGYDIHPGFGFDTEPDRRFRVATATYVLNVIPTATGRIDALRHAASFLAPGGALIVVTRSAASIEREARAHGWARTGDGYLSHRGRQTFQKGMTPAEIAELGRRAGLAESPVAGLPVIADASVVVLRKPGGPR